MEDRFLAMLIPGKFAVGTKKICYLGGFAESILLGLLLLLCFLWFFRKPTATKYIQFETISGEDLGEPLRQEQLSDGTKRKYDL